VQLEFGIPVELVPLALYARTALDRTDYLRLAGSSLTDPTAILNAEDDVLLECVNGNTNRLALLRRAAQAARDGDDAADFADFLPPSID
jgi:helicase